MDMNDKVSADKAAVDDAVNELVTDVEAAKTASTVTKAQIHGVVDQWFSTKVKCGAIARNTPAFNQAFEAIPDLVARLVTLTGASS